jgi:hypothetical protein
MLKGCKKMEQVNIRIDDEIKVKAEYLSTAQTERGQTVHKRRDDVTCIASGKNPVSEITLASEQSLARAWLLSEEDEAWANL